MRDSIIPGIVIEVYPSSLDSERRPKCYRRRSAAHRRPRRQPFGPDTRRSFAQRQLPHPDERYFLKHLALDQKTIWTSPAHIKPADLKWLAPWSGIATGLFITDPASYHPNTWKEVSNYGLGAALGTTAAMYAWGHLTHSERSRPECWPPKPCSTCFLCNSLFAAPLAGCVRTSRITRTHFSMAREEARMIFCMLCLQFAR